MKLSRSDRLRLSDIRNIYGLVARVLEAGDDPDTWRAVALWGLSELIGGSVGLSIDLIGAFPGLMPLVVSPLDVGWTDMATRERYFAYCSSPEMVEDPGNAALVNLHLRVRFMTRTRRQMIDDATWYGSPVVTVARKSGDVDDFVCTSVALRPGTFHGFVIYRPWGATPFGERERRIARLTHIQLLRLLDFSELPGDPSDGMPHLSPRLRQTLDMLLAGEAVKQIAQKLELSPHTVGDYVKSLYQKFDVCTRGELLSRCHAIVRRPRLILPPEMRAAASAGLDRQHIHTNGHAIGQVISS